MLFRVIQIVHKNTVMGISPPIDYQGNTRYDGLHSGELINNPGGGDTPLFGLYGDVPLDRVYGVLVSPS